MLQDSSSKWTKKTFMKFKRLGVSGENCLERTRVFDLDLTVGLAVTRTVRLDLLDNVETLNDLAKDNVLVVQPTALEKVQRLASATRKWSIQCPKRVHE